MALLRSELAKFEKPNALLSAPRALFLAPKHYYFGPLPHYLHLIALAFFPPG
jgi:hypothetical protein